MTVRCTVAAVLLAAFARQAGAAADAPIHVVLRTKDSVHVGRHLRFHDGIFRLRQGNQDAAFPQADVAQVALLRDVDWLAEKGPHRGPPDPVVRLAVALTLLSRLKARRTPRARWLRRLAQTNAFYLPGERPQELFAALAQQVEHPKLAAVLCAETAARCARADALPTAAKLFQGAEERLRADNPPAAFVYALMAAAVAAPPGPGPDKLRLERRLAETYPTQRHRLRQFAQALRRMLQARPDARPFGPPRRPRRRGNSPAPPRGPDSKTDR